MSISRVHWALLFLLLTTAQAPAQTCVDYTQCGTGILGQPDSQYRAEELIVVGGLAYVAGGNDGLVTYSLTDPLLPTLMSTTPLGCFVNEIAQAGNSLFLGGDDYCGVQICDLALPQNPVQVGHWNTSSPVEDLAAVGTCLYVVDTVSVGWDTGWVLRTLDVGDPANPVFVAIVDTLTSYRAGAGAAVTVAGDRLYFANEDSTNIYDISDPFAPALLGGIGEGAQDGLVIADSVAYLARYTTMYMFDVTQPDAPNLLGSYRLQESTLESLGVRGGQVFLGSQNNTIEIVEVSDPANPALLDIAYLPGTPVNLALSSGLIFVANGLDGMYVVGPGGAGDCGTESDLFLPALPYDLVMAGNYAHVVTQTQLLTCDVSDPAAPTVVGFLAVGGEVQGLARAIARAGSELYVAAQDGGLLVATGAGTSSLSWIGSLAYPYAMKVAVQGDICWVLDTARGLCAVDISDPAHPAELSALDLGTFGQQLDVVGDRACVAVYNGQPWVIDISNPAAPVKLGTLPGADNVSGVKLRGSMAYVAARPSGLLIFDVQGAGPYASLGSLNMPELNSVNSLGVSASMAYLGESQNSLYVVDVTNPATPYVIEHLETNGTPNAIVVGPEMVFMTTSASQLSILPAQCDASMLPTPVLGAVAQAGQRLFYWGLPTDENYAETCLYRGTTTGFELGEPLACTDGGVLFDSYQGRGHYVVRHRDTGGRFTFVSNEIEFAAASDVPPVGAQPSLRAAPNPFNPATTITYSAEQESELTLEIFDVSGRRVGELFQGTVPAGVRQFTWRGTDDRGRAVPSGTYFVRARAGAKVLTSRVTLLK